MDLIGKSYVIVGGGSGMGKATARQVVQAGATVELLGRTLERLQAVQAEIATERVTIASLDMRDEAAVHEHFAAKPDGSIDALIISASQAVHGPFANADTDDINTMFASKFMGPFVVAREALPKMAEGSSITFFSGVLSRRPGTNGAGLAAVNGAVEALSRALALELGPKIRVNTLSPGMTDTEAYAGMAEGDRAAMFERVAAKLPVKRVASADEIAQAALFLSTNAFTTGHVLDVDGGHIIGQ